MCDISFVEASGGHDADVRIGGSSEKDSRILRRTGLATRALVWTSAQETWSLLLLVPRNGACAMSLPDIIKSGRISRQNVFHWSGVWSSGESGVSGTPMFMS
jgi:hypothetical protein